MTQEEILKEISLCNENPYYFATKYLKVINHKGEEVSFSTPLGEASFNKIFKEYKSGKKKQIKK